MKYLKYFENKPEIDNNTIRVEGERGWYIDFYFDNPGRRLIYVDNKWHIKLPDWYGFVIDINTIKFWANKYDEKSKTYYLLEHDAKKYNL